MNGKLGFLQPYPRQTLDASFVSKSVDGVHEESQI